MQWSQLPVAAMAALQDPPLHKCVHADTCLLWACPSTLPGDWRARLAFFFLVRGYFFLIDTVVCCSTCRLLSPVGGFCLCLCLCLFMYTQFLCRPVLLVSLWPWWDGTRVVERCCCSVVLCGWRWQAWSMCVFALYVCVPFSSQLQLQGWELVLCVATV